MSPYDFRERRRKKLLSISVTLHRFECTPIFVISEKVLRVYVYNIPGRCFVARVPNDIIIIVVFEQK